ncbi:MAG TPA: DUF3037 domain-containing protein [Flavobacteriales bacterium]|jgi:hypothetical protein|nr:DUF3037 domain-containing protein [Flavobacteriales bacterium]
MHGKHLYEYAVIRVVPALEREEFLNVGVIVFSKRTGFIQVRLAVNAEKLKCFHSEVDLDQVHENLRSFERIAAGAADGGPIAQLDVPSRFRWLTAVRSSAIQTSRPHPGLCDDLEGTVQRLFDQLVR